MTTLLIQSRNCLSLRSPTHLDEGQEVYLNIRNSMGYCLLVVSCLWARQSTVQ